jgi:hypothetical protein
MGKDLPGRCSSSRGTEEESVRESSFLWCQNCFLIYFCMEAERKENGWKEGNKLLLLPIILQNF